MLPFIFYCSFIFVLKTRATDQIFGTLFWWEHYFFSQDAKLLPKWRAFQTIIYLEQVSWLIIWWIRWPSCMGFSIEYMKIAFCCGSSGARVLLSRYSTYSLCVMLVCRCTLLCQHLTAAISLIILILHLKIFLLQFYMTSFWHIIQPCSLFELLFWPLLWSMSQWWNNNLFILLLIDVLV